MHDRFAFLQPQDSGVGLYCCRFSLVVRTLAWYTAHPACCKQPSAVGGMFSMVLLFQQNTPLLFHDQAQNCCSCGEEAQWIFAHGWKLEMLQCMSIHVNGFNVIAAKAVETSGMQFYVSCVDFFLLLEKGEVVSQPVKVWKQYYRGSFFMEKRNHLSISWARSINMAMRSMIGSLGCPVSLLNFNLCN